MLTFAVRCANLEEVMNLNSKNFSYYDSELDYYFIVRVMTEDGVRYAFNQRTLVHDPAFAKRFETRRSARRCILLSGFKQYEVLKIKRTPALPDEA